MKEFKGIVFVGASDVWSVGSRLPFMTTPTSISRPLSRQANAKRLALTMTDLLQPPR